MGPDYSQPSFAPDPPKKKNYTLAIVIVVLALCCGPIPIVAAILFPVFSQARLAARTTQNLSNIKQMSLGVIMYSADFDDRLPPSVDWNKRINPYLKADLLETLSSGAKQPFAYTAVLGSRLESTIPDVTRTPMLFSKKVRAVEEAGGADLIRTPETNEKTVMAFADGHAKAYSKSNAAQMDGFDWEPNFLPEPKGK